MKKIPVLIYTDIGDDIDDSLAISYLAYCEDINIVGIVCDSIKNNYRRSMTKNLLNILGYKTCVLGLKRKKLIKNILIRYSKELVILSIAPNKQLKKDMEDFPILFGNIKRIYFQGQASINNKKISANMQSYNFAQDPEAIKYILKYNIPMTFVGKYIAYEVPITEDDFEIFKKNNPSVFTILYQRAQEWKRKFKKLNPEIFEKLYGKYPNIVSYPYDLITAMLINNKKIFIKKSISKIDLIGQEKNQKGIKNISEFKKYIINIFKK